MAFGGGGFGYSFIPYASLGRQGMSLGETIEKLHYAHERNMLGVGVRSACGGMCWRPTAPATCGIPDVVHICPHARQPTIERVYCEGGGGQQGGGNSGGGNSGGGQQGSVVNVFSAPVSLTQQQGLPFLQPQTQQQQQQQQPMLFGIPVSLANEHSSVPCPTGHDSGGVGVGMGMGMGFGSRGLGMGMGFGMGTGGSSGGGNNNSSSNSSNNTTPRNGVFVFPANNNQSSGEGQLFQAIPATQLSNINNGGVVYQLQPVQRPREPTWVRFV
ncbi:hypothetical protein MCOR27_007178 [Pyricularia oryzae]|uniref:Uncharacterized protein n=5 Tax=Pyricularia TaxID=48558 RepID=A0ABQ8NPH7_PYRGI|nr:uncharacterized protein MGG_17073 [Pyricularia oryzae 70-15]ELQ36544.1 hypothetical protein OOU_Y34scaffold00655g43 [Pyricularia oryzae Y34]KAH8844240.1 hypothetical protein MCOR01_005001 [Pyricularia oryzae]KAI6300222.1 hypothetical protein MCOR33_004014 [Pyricularia grisea]EHA50025.1 hypothetical protein MGG_17073 [Pyricularia oryzae 70-15]KAI6253863.1 hypothetical protein MCOR19_009589 [Pyricularia oryzae]